MLVPNVADVVAAVTGVAGRLTSVVRLANRQAGAVAVPAGSVACDDLSQTRRGVRAVGDKYDWGFANWEHLDCAGRSVARVQRVRGARQSEQYGLRECSAARLATLDGSADAICFFSSSDVVVG